MYRNSGEDVIKTKPKRTKMKHWATNQAKINSLRRPKEKQMRIKNIRADYFTGNPKQSDTEDLNKRKPILKLIVKI